MDAENIIKLVLKLGFIYRPGTGSKKYYVNSFGNQVKIFNDGYISLLSNRGFLVKEGESFSKTEIETFANTQY